MKISAYLRPKYLPKYLRYLLPHGKRLGYIGWLGRGNLGDEAIFEAICVAFNKVEILPYVNLRKISILPNQFLKPLFSSVMLGGGTLIGVPNYCNTLRMSQRIGYPTFAFGTGVQDPEYWGRIWRDSDYLDEWIPLLNQCKYVGVRGPLSKSILDAVGYKHAQVIGDPALLLARSSITPKRMQKKLGINIGSDGKVWGSDEDTILQSICRFSSYMIDKGWSITFVPAKKTDLRYIKDAMKVLGNNVKMFTRFTSVEKVLDEIESCDVFIGERLHSSILSCCTYTPTIMLEYRPKCRDFMALMQLERYNMRTDAVNIEELISLCEDLYDNNDQMQKHLFAAVNYYKNKLLIHMNNILNMYGF
jgi:polysaccharide pyruvyl transferase WcaK-like protein